MLISKLGMFIKSKYSCELFDNLLCQLSKVKKNKSIDID